MGVVTTVWIVEPVAGVRAVLESVDNDGAVDHRFLRSPDPDRGADGAVSIKIEGRMVTVLMEIVEPLAGVRAASESVDNDGAVDHRFLRSPDPDRGADDFDLHGDR
jgi:hypothetical protein